MAVRLIALLVVSGLWMVGCSEESPAVEGHDHSHHEHDHDHDHHDHGDASADLENLAVTVPAVDVQQYTSLHDLMEEVDDLYKYLRRYGAEGDLDTLKSKSAQLRALVDQAKAMTPKQVTEAPAEKQQELADAYEKHLNSMIPALDAVDASLAANDREALAKAVRDLHETEEHGHEALGVDDH